MPPAFVLDKFGIIGYLTKLFKLKFKERYSNSTNVVTSSHSSKMKALKNVEASPKRKDSWQPGKDDDVVMGTEAKAEAE